jgi:citrate synthase
MVQEADLHRGLRGVYLDTTESSNVVGDIGKLVYRGYNIHDLAEKSTFEETLFLLLHGHLPTSTDLQQFDTTLRNARTIPSEVIDIIEKVKQAHPMDVLRTAISALAAFDEETADNSPEATLRKGIRLTAQAPTIVTAHHRIRNGNAVIAPDPSLNHAGNFLHMLHGKQPDQDAVDLMDKDLIVHLDHGSNASAFAARVTAATRADLHGAVVSGIATLKGPLHGGAAEAVMKMALEIGDESNAEAYLEQQRANNERIMGFGHAVYKVEDPRARHLREGSKRLGEKMGQPQWFRILSKVEELMAPYAERGICVNVDFWAGSAYFLMDIPEDLFVPIFAIARVPGYVVQVLEQQKTSSIIRPLLQYVGPEDLEYIPIEKRG